MLYCFGVERDAVCPMKAACYRHTQPAPGRDRFGRMPFDFVSGTCAEFVSNIPSEDFIRRSAYYLWLAAGKPDHRDLEFWTQARNHAEVAMGRPAAAHE